MKKIYLVHERGIVNGREDNYCGIAYYSSLKKAEADFYNRCKNHNVKEEDIKKEGKSLVTYDAISHMSSTYKLHIQLNAHEVY